MIDGREGPDHDPLFTVSVQLAGFEPASGSGRTKRAGRTGGGGGDPSARRRLETGNRRMSETAEQAEPTTHSGFVALIGAPNAGKSTLVNQLVGTKVSIVTHKVQTTRAIVRGIATHRDAQIVLRRHARHLQAAPRARPRHGDDRLGRRQGCRHRARADRRRARHQGRCRHDPRQPRGCAPAEDPGPQQGRPGAARSRC